MKICEVEDCERRATARGMCDTHYARWRRHGTTDELAPRRRRRPTAEELLDEKRAWYSAWRAAHPLVIDESAPWAERAQLVAAHNAAGTAAWQAWRPDSEVDAI